MHHKVSHSKRARVPRGPETASKLRWGNEIRKAQNGPAAFSNEVNLSSNEVTSLRWYLGGHAANNGASRLAFSLDRRERMTFSSRRVLWGILQRVVIAGGTFVGG
jgi:hypothetical protein